MKKQYKLLQWYPSLGRNFVQGEVYVYDENKSEMNVILTDKKSIKITYNGFVAIHELHPDFWQLVEEKEVLFTTYDGVEIIDHNTETHAVDKRTFEKLPCEAYAGNYEHYLYFAHESNAYKYIDENKPKPLFITEDGVEIFLGHSYILIDKEFIKHKQTASNIVYTEYFKKFKHESNADEYIWKNKRVFSYEEMKKANIDINWCTADIYYKAKERANEK